MNEENSLIKHNVWVMTLTVIGGIFLLSSFTFSHFKLQHNWKI